MRLVVYEPLAFLTRIKKVKLSLLYRRIPCFTSVLCVILLK